MGDTLSSGLGAAEIAVGFTTAEYQRIRGAVDPEDPTTPSWTEVISAFRRRMEERFVRPIAQLLALASDETVPGFAVLALDCLLIDTLQSFREGRATTGEVSPAKSFTTFLRARRVAAEIARVKSRGMRIPHP